MRKIVLAFIMFPLVSFASDIYKQAMSMALMHAGTAAVSAATGSKFYSMCSSKNPYPCVLGALSFLQAGASGKSAAGSGITGADSFDYLGGVKYPDFSGLEKLDEMDFSRLNSAPNLNSPEMKKVLKAGGLKSKDILAAIKAQRGLRDMGYNVDPKTGVVKGPNGLSLSGEDINNPSKLAKQGVDLAEFKATQDALAKMQKGFKKKGLGEAYKSIALDFASSGASGGRQRANSNYGGEEDFNFNIGRNSLLDQLKKKNSVKGLTRTLAGERIGVAGDDIFQMVRRKYESKKRSNHFLP